VPRPVEREAAEETSEDWSRSGAAASCAGARKLCYTRAKNYARLNNYLFEASERLNCSQDVRDIVNKHTTINDILDK